MPEYFLILIFLLITAIFLHRKYKIKIYNSRKHLFWVNIIVFLVGLAWDQFAIWRGHWSFGEQFLLGPRIGLMPIEEFGFLFITMHFVLVIYKIVEKYSHH